MERTNKNNNIMNVETFREFCLSLPYATEDMPFDDTVLVFRLKGKIFACLALDKPDMAVMKCDPVKAEELREQCRRRSLSLEQKILEPNLF